MTTTIVELSVALSRRGHEVELWALSPWDNDDRSCHIRRLNDAEVPLATVGDRSAVDVVHFHNTFSPKNNALARTLDVPYVLTTHGGYAPEQLAYHAYRKRLFKILRERPFLRRAGALVALTPEGRDEIHSFAGRSAVVIPNGVRYPPREVDGRRFRHELGLGDELLAVYAGRLDRYQKRLDDAISSLVGSPEWHLALVGPDWRGGREALARLGAARGVADRVFFVDERRGVRYHESLAAADAFFLPSRWEGQSIALLEALAHGVPALVSTEVEGRLGVAAAGAGLSVRSGEGDVGLEALGALLGDDEKRAHLRAQATTYAQRFAWPEAAASYETLFDGLVGGT